MDYSIAFIPHAMMRAGITVNKDSILNKVKEVTGAQKVELLDPVTVVLTNPKMGIGEIQNKFSSPIGKGAWFL